MFLDFILENRSVWKTSVSFESLKSAQLKRIGIVCRRCDFIILPPRSRRYTKFLGIVGIIILFDHFFIDRLDFRLLIGLIH